MSAILSNQSEKFVAPLLANVKDRPGDASRVQLNVSWGYLNDRESPILNESIQSRCISLVTLALDLNSESSTLAEEVDSVAIHGNASPKV